MPVLRPSSVFAAVAQPLRRLSLPALCCALLASPLVAQAQQGNNQRWVSDQLSTFVRSGPTDGYRIVGTLTSGQAVELLQQSGDYSQVRSEGGDRVWIPTRDLQDKPGQGERVPQLEQQVSELSGRLGNIDEEWKKRVQGMQETLDARKSLVDELQSRADDLGVQLAQSQAELREARAQLGNEQQRVLMRYMVYGGCIAGAGLLAGLLLPTFTRRRKRNDVWV